MTEDQFVDAVIEYLFVQGFNCRNQNLLSMRVRMAWERLGASSDPTAFAEECLRIGDIALQPKTPNGDVPSKTAGAGAKWLAVHEAGHAIVGIDAGLKLWGVRFHGRNGLTGETGFEEFHWGIENNDDVLRRHIRVDVAANLAEMILAVREPDGGYPSRFFDAKRPTPDMQMPSDIIGAWKKAHRVVTVRHERAGKAIHEDNLWNEGRVIVVGAEQEAEHILKNRLETLARLAEKLQLGPMTGACVRAMMQA